MDEELRKIWAKVRREHLFPELPNPAYGEGDEKVGLDIKAKQITISRDFINAMKDKVEESLVLEGLLDHAVSHYLYCPWDLSTHLKLYGEAKKVLKDKEMAQRATDCFLDVVADTFCMAKKNSPITLIYRHCERGPLQEAIHSLLQRIWGVDLGVDGFEDLSRKLSRLPYLDRAKWRDTVRRFARAIQPLLEQEKQQRGINTPSSTGSHSLDQYSYKELEKGLQELAQDSARPKEFKQIVKDFEKELQEALKSARGMMGLGSGNSFDADILYYMKLAENYSLPVRKTPMEKSGALYPHHHTPWEVGSPYQDVDPWTSFGKIMPGITQIWKRTEGKVFGREEGVPDCVVMIDSSASMADPKEHLSYAVLGAACACDAYLRNEARVAVYNFSDASSGGKRLLAFSHEREEIYRAICHYFGGGTRILIEDIEEIQSSYKVGPQGSSPDIFLITDMQITNLRELIQYFNGLNNRVTAVHIGSNEHVRQFKRSMEVRKNVWIYGVEKKEDIPNIVLGRIREYMDS